MTQDPQFTAGFNAGIEAARKTYAEWLDDGDFEMGFSAVLSALTVPSDLVAVPRRLIEPFAHCEHARISEWHKSEGCLFCELRAMLSAYEEKKDE